MSNSNEDGYASGTASPRRPVFYAVIYAEMAARARELGYALSLHGSLNRDLDVVAIPWTHDAVSEADLIAALAETADGVLLGGVLNKPHGRRAQVIVTGASHYIDLSIMPRHGTDEQPQREQSNSENTNQKASE